MHVLRVEVVGDEDEPARLLARAMRTDGDEVGPAMLMCVGDDDRSKRIGEDCLE